MNFRTAVCLPLLTHALCRWVELQPYAVGMDGSRLSTARHSSYRSSDGVTSPSTPISPSRKPILTKSAFRPNTAPTPRRGSLLTPRPMDLSLAVDWGVLYARYIAVKPPSLSDRRAPPAATSNVVGPAQAPGSPLRRPAWSAPATRSAGARRRPARSVRVRRNGWFGCRRRRRRRA